MRTNNQAVFWPASVAPIQSLPRRCLQKHRCWAPKRIRQRQRLFSPSPYGVGRQACPGPELWFQGLCLRSVEANNTMMNIIHSTGETKLVIPPPF